MLFTLQLETGLGLGGARVWSIQCDMLFRWNDWNAVQSAAVIRLPGRAEDGRR